VSVIAPVRSSRMSNSGREVHRQGISNARPSLRSIRLARSLRKLLGPNQLAIEALTMRRLAAATSFAWVGSTVDTCLALDTACPDSFEYRQ